MELRNPQTLDQSLNQIEGMFVLRTKGPADTNTRIQTRGFNGSSRTLVLLDGQPMNDAYTGEVPGPAFPSAK
jgi:iron complex outermembrane receptor protein